MRQKNEYNATVRIFHKMEMNDSVCCVDTIFIMKLNGENWEYYCC